MNHDKKNHIERIRSESAYPAFRMMTEMGYWILIAVAGLGLLLGFVGAFFGNAGVVGIGSGILWFVIFYFLGHVFKEASLMLADVADSITDANCRHEE